MEVCESPENKEESSQKPKRDCYVPGHHQLKDGEQLVCDQSAYVMLHQATVGNPCLSFDILGDFLGNDRKSFPMTAYMVTGTQSSQANSNQIVVVRLSNLHKTGATENDDSSNDDDDASDNNDDDYKEPCMTSALIKHQGIVNRIRACQVNNGQTTLVAAWSATETVSIWNINEQLAAVESEAQLRDYRRQNQQLKSPPIYTFRGHTCEGYALDWCSMEAGHLATGDCSKNIHLWKPTISNWQVSAKPLVGHTASVEDLQWSPSEKNVLASCSVDRSIRIWDVRVDPSRACMLTVEDTHQTDVNVIHWNRNESFIVSGGDDGFLHVWDLRHLQNKTPIATFKHHTQPVTSVEWHPTDSAVFCSSGEDDQVALWDLSVELDEAETTTQAEHEIDGISPQLLFIHQGQKHIKEVHWHRQIPGLLISTAESGFNVFKTISV